MARPKKTKTPCEEKLSAKKVELKKRLKGFFKRVEDRPKV